MVTVWIQFGASFAANGEGDVQRARYMTLETVAPLREDPSSCPPGVPSLTRKASSAGYPTPRQGTPSVCQNATIGISRFRNLDVSHESPPCIERITSWFSPGR
jgi:hypothetical protein